MASKNEEKIYENMKSLEEWAFAGLSQKEMADGIFNISGAAEENSGTFGTLEKKCRFFKSGAEKGS